MSESPFSPLALSLQRHSKDYTKGGKLAFAMVMEQGLKESMTEARVKWWPAKVPDNRPWVVTDFHRGVVDMLNQLFELGEEAA